MFVIKKILTGIIFLSGAKDYCELYFSSGKFYIIYSV